jgi:hypothetical protein
MPKIVDASITFKRSPALKLLGTHHRLRTLRGLCLLFKIDVDPKIRDGILDGARAVG